MLECSGAITFTRQLISGGFAPVIFLKMTVDR